ncbi:hypothetical protein MBLNU459_g8368t1 [Dothideomycetes sp. NU459]
MSRGALRRQAFEKLASLSAHQHASSATAQDLPRLCSLYQAPVQAARNDADQGPQPAAHRAMGVRELEVLVALCRAAPSVSSLEHAERLLQQIAPYLPEAHAQTFRSSPFLRDFQPSPWEILVREVASAVLAIGLNHPSLRPHAVSYIVNAVKVLAVQGERIAWNGSDDEAADNELDIVRAAKTIRFTVSLLGLLTALSSWPETCSAEERASVIFQLRAILSERSLVAIEGTFSSVRNAYGQDKSVREWKRVLKSYASKGRPLGAMLLQHAFMQYVTSATAMMVTSPANVKDGNLLDHLLQGMPVQPASAQRVDEDTLEGLVDLIAEQIALQDAGADYLQLSSAWQQNLAFSAKANSLTSYLCCSLLNEEIADADVLMSWLEAIMTDPVQLANEGLASTTLKCLAILAHTSQSFASTLGRSLPRFIVQGRMTDNAASIAANALADILQLLSQDLIISTLYSLGNVLSTGSNRGNLSLFFDGNANPNGSSSLYTQNGAGSTISLVTNDMEETAVVHGTVVEAIVAIARRCQDDKITALAISMLVQKVGRASSGVDAKIVTGSAALGLQSGPNELRPLLRLYSRLASEALAQDNEPMLRATMEARLYLARQIPKSSPLHEVYLVHILDSVVSTSDAQTRDGKSSVNEKLAVGQIAQLLPPWAALAVSNPTERAEYDNWDQITALSRDAWFNLVAHDFVFGSRLGKAYHNELQTIAWYTPSLIDMNRTSSQESGIDLNTVLRRGMGPQHAAQMKVQMANALPAHEADIRTLDYGELTFLNAAHLVGTLRAESGDCTRTMEYFPDPKFKTGPLSNCVLGVALKSVDTYLTTTSSGRNQTFAAPELALQLAKFFEGCCHRIDKVQHVAMSSADRIINQVPSALCQRTSLFALLELLTLMWTSCLEAETDEYEWKSTYTSTKGNVSVHLSDDFAFRQVTLRTFHQRCRKWVSNVMELAPLDMKGLLQTYLSDYDDEGAYGHISLGRSFAVEMGSLIPVTDQRLGAIDRQRDLGINTASDFVAQYSTRQEYRFIDAIGKQDEESMAYDRSGIAAFSRPALDGQTREAAVALKEVDRRIRKHEQVSSAELRSVLRRAAALLCNVNVDRSSLIQLLVGIPFTLFTKQSLKLGISLWMGVVKENAKQESRILAEIATNWEMTVQRKRGIFSQSFQHLDPFYVKEEFAPSDKTAITKRQQSIHDLIAPHFRLMQFLSSHFNATRLSSPHVERIFFRMTRITLAAMRRGAAHPLAREVHFHVVLLALRVLTYSTGCTAKAHWELKDQVLSAGLAWFAFPPRWSYGGNKLQIKAEVQVMSDIIVALQSTANMGMKVPSSMVSLQPKQELLSLLLSSEITRLSVWLAPLGQESSHSSLGYHTKPAVAEAAIASLIKTAWQESPKLAVQLAYRYPSAQVQAQVRWQLVNFPEKALGDPDALQLMLGSALPGDISFQLKYLLYWAPVNPITAVTYFLPAYGNHPFIIQYAMRALESHSVDVTFFYVPQIVQTLRYDLLGYVERYIVETAKFSQLFAHQIIWNMKANAYKDDESQIPDPVKPALDQVEQSLLASLSADDRAFYEREFGFFNEVTSISGKLKPYIKRPKPEKKQKIEEELRKIQVEVGVYLPSNPDGVVIGIDRKSGKPLQSHAKAPYMATFRIRKERGNVEALEALDEEVDQIAESGIEAQKSNTYEVWQSAIFKVGDDCRQDVLALQMIAAFRGIFNNVGLDVYVFPYRVTATAPGCGVIDVLPNSISRDMLGREAVNGLYEYFVSKYGTEDSLAFQAARNNFVKSMAAYSVISYLLQFKDRHNGNIMVDDAGHILHIDFGFIFDIAPGGVKFERAPFKLTSEMVAVMGGSTQSQPYKWFEELCVKAFLASRPHAEKLSHLVVAMIDSGLPCFKPETVQHFKERFVLDKSEREAAEFMRMLIHRSERSYSTGVYDGFQLLTNGIPY